MTAESIVQSLAAVNPVEESLNHLSGEFLGYYCWFCGVDYPKYENLPLGKHRTACVWRLAKEYVG